MVAVTGSTNADLSRARRAPARPPASSWSPSEQTAGRGRLDRAWVAPAAIRRSRSRCCCARPVPARRLGWLPLLAGLAVADAVRAATGLTVGLKWPNDVLAGDRKLGGILVERVGGTDAAVVGIGLNVAMHRRRAAGQHLSFFLRPPAAARWRSAGARPSGLHPPFHHLRRRGPARRSSRRPTARSGSTKRSSCSTARRSPRISHAKNTQADRRRISTSRRSTRRARAVAALFEEYEKALRNANALDFDDLLLEAVRLLQHDEATREAWNRRLSYVMIDEYQDTNRTPVRPDAPADRSSTATSAWWAMRTSRSIAGAARTSRTSSISSTIIPKAKTIRLEQNYRSTKNILAAAGAVVENNKARKGKKLWTEAGRRRPDRALRRLRRRERGAVHRRHDREVPGVAIPSDHVAVLYRTNSQSRQIEEALRRYGRKYNVVGGFSFYQRAEIKDTVAYLKLAASNTDSVSLMRVINTPARGIGRTTVEQIEKLRARARPEPVGGDRADHRRSAALHALAIVAGGVPQPDSGTVAGGQLVAAAGSDPLHSGPHRLQEDAAAGEDAGIGNAPGEPGRTDQRRRGSGGARRDASAIFWIMPPWWRMPMRSTNRRRSP